MAKNSTSTAAAHTSAAALGIPDATIKTITEKKVAEKKPAGPEIWHVIDPASTKAEPRTHFQLVDGERESFEFAGKPLSMPSAIAVKFLKNEGFVRVDENGKRVEYERARQPEELGAGEKFKLNDDETVAKYPELSLDALVRRAAELPGGEKFGKSATRPDKAAVIAFIVEKTVELRKANSSPEERSDDEFTPEAEIEDAA